VSTSYIARIVADGLAASSDTLYVIAAYNIGKERVLSAVAAAAGVSIAVDAQKHAALSCLGLEDAEIYTTDASASPVRVVGWGVLGETWPFFQPNWSAMEKLRAEAGVARLVGFVPTGWMHEMARGMERGDFPVRRKEACEVHLVPYSEHSSYSELRDFVRWLRPHEVVPTVGLFERGGETREGERAKAAMLTCFRNLVDETAAKRAFISKLGSAPPAQTAEAAEAAEPGAAAEDDDWGGIVEAPPPAANDRVAALRALAGESLSDARAAALLRAVGGDVNAAANALLDGAAAAQPGGGKRPRSSGGAAQPSIAAFFAKQPSPAGATAPPPPRRSEEPSCRRSEEPPAALRSDDLPGACLSPPPASPSAAQTLGAAQAGSAERQLEEAARVALPVAEYDPSRHACWPAGSPAPYLHVAATCAAVSATRSRIAIAASLTNFFRALLSNDTAALLPALYLLCGRVAPEHEGGAELGVGGSAVAAALAEATGSSRAAVGELYRRLGDLGDAAAQLKGGQRQLVAPKPLGIAAVFAELKAIGAEKGEGGAARRKARIVRLLRACRGPEARFLVRTLVCNLRIGASRFTVLAALAHACAHAAAAAPPAKEELEAASAAVAKAYALCPSFDALVPALLEGGVEAARRICLMPGVPCAPMLAQPTRGVEEALGRLGAGSPFIAEYKYDGQRCAVHVLPDFGGVRLFTRAGGCCTSAFPDVVAAVTEAVAGGPASLGAVIDAEIVAVDDRGSIRPFQELATRARGAVVAADVSVRVCAFLFDCLASGGRTLVEESLATRRDALRDALPRLAEVRGRLQLADCVAFEQRSEGDEAATVAAVEAALSASLAARCEGLMLKSLSAVYEPDKRCAAWLKLKKDYIAGSQTDLDLVPIGAWTGRKCAWFSPFLMAVYCRETETWQSACRVMSGFSDALYKQLHAFYCEEGAERLLPAKPPYYATHEAPDVWLAPCAVWELRGADFSLSTVHCAAAGLAPQGRGIALRFPRFVRLRPDRGAEEATAPSELLELYHAQPNKADAGPGDDE